MTIETKTPFRRIYSGSDQERLDATPSWLENEVKKRIEIIKPDKVIFVGVTNRTNTGALSTALGRSTVKNGITRHIQPLKAIARRLVQEQLGVIPSTPLQYLKSDLIIDKGTHLVKETIGPNRANPAEWLNAFELLLEAGLAPEKVALVPTFREPLDTALSWRRMWGWSLDEFPFDAFNESFAFTMNLWITASQLGAVVAPYVHELLREVGTNQVVAKMCHKIGIPFSQQMVTWEDEDAYWTGKIVKYDLPPDEWIRGALGRPSGGRGELVWRPVEAVATPEEARFIMERTKPAHLIWQEAATKAREVLGL